MIKNNMIDKPIYLSDLIDSKPLEPARLTQEEVRDFIESVNSEMRRLGFDKANELTERSTNLTDEDYQTYINY